MVFITTITIYRNIWAGRLNPDIHLFWGRHLKIIHYHHHCCHHLQHHGIQWSQKTSENFIHQSSRYFISHKALGPWDSICVCNDLGLLVYITVYLKIAIMDTFNVEFGVCF